MSPLLCPTLLYSVSLCSALSALLRMMRFLIFNQLPQSVNVRLKEYELLHSFFDAWLLIAVRNAESAGIPLGEPVDDTHKVCAISKSNSLLLYRNYG